MTELSIDEESALVDHLRVAPGRMEQHIRDGGTFDAYVAGWKAERDEAARRKLPSPEVVAQVLDCPVVDGYGDPAGTVRDYLVELLAAFWAGEADPKRGIEGSSDWRYRIYGPLNRAGLIPGWREGYGIGYRADGTVDRNDEKRANALILAAIRTMSRDLATAAVTAILNWAADEMLAQDRRHGGDSSGMLDLTDHIRCFDNQPNRRSIVPWPDLVPRPGRAETHG